MSGAFRLFACLLVSVLLVGTSSAQLRNNPRDSYSYHEPGPEIYGMAGYQWTWSRDIWNAYTGREAELDIESSWNWSGGINLPAPQGSQIELAYGYQGSEFTVKDFSGKETLADVSVQYLQIGALKGIPRGNVLPFTSITLGATRYGVKEFTFEGVQEQAESIWKFSAVLGVGVKYYTQKSAGIRLNFRMPVTFTSGGVGIGCGGGGCGATVGGTGITQFEMAAGIFIAR